jgi:20S proteasome alpha/beta subunit
VTIVTALICKKGIVLASDSRTTNPDGTHRDDTKKISILKFADGNEALVAQAGNADLGERVVEILTSMASTIPLNDRRAGADAAQDAISELKNQLRLQFKGTAEELQKHLNDYHFELMLVYFFEEVPCIFTLDLVLGQSIPKKYSIYSIGCGSILADFCLKGFEVEKMPFNHAMTTAIYAIEEVKQFDSRCGGETQIGKCEFKDGRSKALLIDSGMTENLRELIVYDAAKAKAQWQQEIQRLIFRGSETDKKEDVPF